MLNIITIGCLQSYLKADGYFYLAKLEHQCFVVVKGFN